LSMCTANALRLLQESGSFVREACEEKPLSEVDKSNLSELVEGY
jgi:hypothetical protein